MIQAIIVNREKENLDESEASKINLLRGISALCTSGARAVDDDLRGRPSLPEMQRPAVEDAVSRPCLPGRQTHFGSAQLHALNEFFPIGKALRYSPDAQLAIVLDTIIVAYRADDHFIYSRNAIKTDDQGRPLALTIHLGQFELPVDQIQQLHLVVPDTSDLERTLDYDRRAIIGRSQQFVAGHAITLIANSGAKGVSTMETRVAEQITIDHGPYSNNRMILLSPDLGTLDVKEQLHKRRGNTHASVALHFKKGVPPYRCVLIDFSESAVGLRRADTQHSMPAMEPDDSVIMVIKIGETEKLYTIKGRVLRRSTDSCAIRLVDLLKGNRFSGFTLLDSLQFRTDLLNCGNAID